MASTIRIADAIMTIEDDLSYQPRQWSQLTHKGRWMRTKRELNHRA